MKKINFTKMHGAGNDYIYINCLNGLDFDPSDLSKKMSPRHFSVGSDGVVLICSSDTCDAKMRMFNLDGSEGKMCGNAIRCVGKYLYDGGFVKKDVLTIETLSGVKTLHLTVQNGKVVLVKVDMGKASFDAKVIPVISASPEMIDQEVEVLGSKVKGTAVSMGNPHFVIFTNDIKSLDLEKIGPSYEKLSIFPESVNTEFVEQVGKTELNMRVWERGSGETYACGTGASATVAAAVKLGKVPQCEDITVHLIGGDLIINVDKDYNVTMTGAATKVYEGVYDYED